MRRHFVLAAMLLFSVLVLDTHPRAQAGSAGGPPSDPEIQTILRQRIDDAHQGVGMVVGLIDGAGRRRIVSYGHLAKDDTRPLDGNTVFEIG